MQYTANIFPLTEKTRSSSHLMSCVTPGHGELSALRSFSFTRNSTESVACSNAFGHRVDVTVAKTTEATHFAPMEPSEIDRVTMADGRTLVLRHIHAGDVVPLQRGFARLSPEEVRMRFLHPLTELPHDFA